MASSYRKGARRYRKVQKGVWQAGLERGWMGEKVPEGSVARRH